MIISVWLGVLGDQSAFLFQQRVERRRIAMAIFEQCLGKFEEWRRYFGGFLASFILSLWIVGVELYLGLTKIACRQMAADLATPCCEEIAVLKLEQFVGRRTILVFTEIYHL